MAAQSPQAAGIGTYVSHEREGADMANDATTARLTRRGFIKGAATLGAVAALGTKLFDGPQKSLAEGEPDPSKTEDRWVTSVCRQCRVFCPIKVHVVNGVAVKIDGNPDDPNAQGRICGKSQAGIMSLYDPYRVKAPMIRTNPEKGIGVDPMWKELTWDEAIDILAEKLQPVLEEDPTQFEVMTSNFTDDYARRSMRAFYGSFGIAASANVSAGAIGWQDGICGDGAHRATLRTLGGFVDATDYEYCNYMMFFGTNYFGSGKGWPTPTRSFLKARERGMKVVVIDPVQADLARMADEWIPIKPGTDQAFCLGMMYTLVHELDLYDHEHIKMRTNSPYLIGPDGMYVRNEDDTYTDKWRLGQDFGKPMIWDPVDGCAKSFDDPTIKDFALEGTYEVNGVECHPGWQLYTEFLEQYTPEWAESVCDVPAATIRRIAKEWGEAACIGQTMVFDDDPDGPYEVPYRPVSLICHKGAQAHYHCMLICRAAYMLTTLVGAANVVGSSRGSEGITVDPTPAGDGVITEGPEFTNYTFSYPPKKTKDIYFFGPETRDMDVINDPEHHAEDAALYRDKLSRKIMFHQFRNPIKSRGTGKYVVEAMKQIPFIWTVPLVFDEMAEMSDLLLPEGSYLERCAVVVPGTRALKGSWWEYNPDYIKDFEALMQPVVDQVYDTKQIMDIMTLLATRMGYLAEWNEAVTSSLAIKEEYALEPDVQYPVADILDRHLKSRYGDEYGFEYFSEHGFRGLPSVSRKAWYGYTKHPETRWPIYDEWWVWAREQYKGDRAKYGLSPHTEAYNDLIGLPEWHGIGPIEGADEEYDLTAVHYGNVFTAMCTPMEDPWRGDYMQKFARELLSIRINAQTAAEKGLKTGDRVLVESQYGNTQEGDVYVSECIRPDTIGITGGGPCLTTHIGPYARYGLHFNKLLCHDSWTHDQVTGNADFCCKVKLTKISEG